MNEQDPADGSDTPRTNAAKAIVAQFASDECVELVGELVGQLERELAAMTTLSRGAVVEATDLRASLRREENARKIAEKDAERYRWWRRYVFQDRNPLSSLVEAESLEELDAAIDTEMANEGKRP